MLLENTFKFNFIKHYNVNLEKIQQSKVFKRIKFVKTKSKQFLPLKNIIVFISAGSNALSNAYFFIRTQVFLHIDIVLLVQIVIILEDYVKNWELKLFHAWLFWTRPANEGEHVWEGVACTLCHMYPIVGSACISKNIHEHTLLEYIVLKQQYSLEQIFASVPYLLDPNN